MEDRKKKIEEHNKIEENIIEKYQPEKNKKKLIEAICTIFVFLLLIFGFTIASIVTPVKGFSENENRKLQQKPVFTWNTLFDGSFAADYEKFITDQFVQRDRWVGIKTRVELALQKKDVKGVYFAEDGYLIEKHDSTSIDQEQMTKNENRLTEFVKKYADILGEGKVQAMLVPTASEILRDKLPPFASGLFDQSGLVERVKESVGGKNFTDVSETLKSHSEDYIFYRTDHHWTTEGAYYAYRQWAEKCGFTPWEKTEYDIRMIDDKFYGTIFSKVNIPMDPDEMYAYMTDEKYTVEYNMDGKKFDTLYNLDSLLTKDKYTVFLNGNNPLVQIDTETKNGRKLLIIKDSFAHSFTPFAVNHYEQIFMIDLRYFNMPISKFIEQNGITDILVLYNVINFISDRNIYQLAR